MAIDDAAHHAADAYPLGRLSQGGERGPRFHAGPRGVRDVDGVKVVEVPGGVEYLHPIGRPPDVEHVMPGSLDSVKHLSTPFPIR